MVEASPVPAKATCQCHNGIWRDGVDGLVNQFGQGLGLGLAHSPGDVSIVQETYQEKSKWLARRHPDIWAWDAASHAPFKRSGDACQWLIGGSECCNHWGIGAAGGRRLDQD